MAVLDLAEFLVESLVGEDADVEISEKLQGKQSQIDIHAGPEYADALVGKDGETAKSIKLALNIAAYKQNLRVSTRVNAD